MLLLRLLANLFAVAGWPLRALLRAARRRRPPRDVEIVLRGALRDRRPERPWLRFWAGSADRAPALDRLRELAKAVQRTAATRGVLLVLEGEVRGSAAQWAELAALIAELRAAGKRVAVYAETLGNASFAALAGSELIVLPPSGSLELTGVGAELVSAGPLFRRLGIRPRFARRAAYKTAPELFTEAAASPAQRETTERLLDQVFESLAGDLAARRGWSQERARRAIDGGPYSGRTALAAGLIEATGFRDQLPQLIAGRFDGPKPATDDPRRPPSARREGLPPASLLLRENGWSPPRLRPLRPPRQVGLVRLAGTIRSGKSAALPGWGSMLGSDTAVAALAAARRDRRVATALVTIDSRGGSALASEIVWRELVRLAAEKPTRVYIDAMAASGGYLIACGAPRILAAPLAIVGSIGVFTGHFDLSGLFAWLGVQREFIGRGARAGLARSGALSQEEWSAVEGLADDTYAAFVALVASARHKTQAETEALAQGKVFTGREAAALGLIDGVCGFRAALAEAAAAGGLDADAPAVRGFGGPPGGGLAGLLRLGAAAAFARS